MVTGHTAGKVVAASEGALPGVGVVLLDLLHELRGQPDGNVEVLEVALLVLAVEELEDIRVIDAHNSHVRSVTVLLFDDTKGSVVDVQEGDGTGGRAEAGLGDLTGGSHKMKRETQTTPGLLEKSSILQSLKNALHRIIDVQNNTVGDKGGGGTDVGEGTTGRGEVEVGQHGEVLLGQVLNIGVAHAPLLLMLGDGFGDTVKHVFRILLHNSLEVSHQIPLGDDLKSIHSEGQTSGTSTKKFLDLGFFFRGTLDLIGGKDGLGPGGELLDVSGNRARHRWLCVKGRVVNGVVGEEGSGGLEVGREGYSWSGRGVGLMWEKGGGGGRVVGKW